jgi:hypothetical protein
MFSKRKDAATSKVISSKKPAANTANNEQKIIPDLIYKVGVLCFYHWTGKPIKPQSI